MKKVSLTQDQLLGIKERIEDHVDSSSYDWQLEEEEHNAAITFWSDILRKLGFPDDAQKLDKNYSI